MIKPAWKSLALAAGLVIAIATAGAGSARMGPVPATVSRHEIEVDGTRRTYRLYVPPSVQGQKVPLLIALHGRFGTGDTLAELSNLDELANRFGFIVAYPDGIGRSWNAGHGVGRAARRDVDDVGFVAKLIDQLEADLPIDGQRIFASGMSAGAIFSYRLACELSDRIRGIAAIAGTMAPETARACEPQRPVAIIHFHGTADRLSPWAGGETAGGGRILSVEETVDWWVERNQCPAQPEVIYQQGDSYCTAYGPCAGRTRVALCRIEGGGHTWPSGSRSLSDIPVGRTTEDLQASEQLWSFFANLPE